MLSIIVAIGRNGEIGKNNSLIWHLPEDLKRFKEITMYKTIIMGRKTFESLPKALPNRKHIIITRDANYKPNDEQVYIANSFAEVMRSYGETKEEAFIIGGGEIYALALDYCKKLYITFIDSDFPADVFFPKFDKSKYIHSESEYFVSEKNSFRYKYIEYTKK